MSAETLKLVIGVCLVLYGGIRLVFRTTPIITPSSRLPDVAVGVVGGLVSGAAAIPGVVWSFWCGLRGWSKDEQRAVYQPLNIATVVFTLVGFAISGLVTREVITYALWCTPVALLGVACGIPLYRRISEMMFQTVVLSLLTAMGVLLIAGNLFTS